MSIHDKNAWFDPVEGKVLRDFSLNLSLPYERAIALVLFHLVACHSTNVFGRIEYDPIESTLSLAETPIGGSGGGGGGGADEREEDKKSGFNRNGWTSLALIQQISYEKSQYFDDKERQIVENLRKAQAAAENTRIAIKIFKEMDQDGSGELDKHELSALLSSLGIEMDPKRLDDVMNTYDLDGSGKIELNEFLFFLQSKREESASRLQDILSAPIYTLEGSNEQVCYIHINTYIYHCVC
jgi:hypothetical protein